MVRNTSFESDRICITCKLLRETDKAFFIETEDLEIWIPKSQSELYKNEDGSYDMFIEEWLAKKRGLT